MASIQVCADLGRLLVKLGVKRVDLSFTVSGQKGSFLQMFHEFWRLPDLDLIKAYPHLCFFFWGGVEVVFRLIFLSGISKQRSIIKMRSH